jgi:multiple antibiotic resistance protein
MPRPLIAAQTFTMRTAHRHREEFDLDWDDVRLFSQAVVSIFAIVNPIGNLPIFLGLTEDLDNHRRKHVLRMASATALLILCVMAVAGNFLLDKVFHIDLYEFAFGGGLLLVVVGVRYLLSKPMAHSGRAIVTENPEVAETDQIALAVSPIACPLLVGPGSIVTVMLIVSDHAAHGIAFGMLYGVAASLVAFLFVGMILNYANLAFRIMGPAVTIAVGRVMQIFIVAIGVHFIFSSLSKMIPILMK